MTDERPRDAMPGSEPDPDFSERYRQAKSDSVLFDRSLRGRVSVTGRAPGQMLEGVLTGRIPAPLSTADGVDRGTRTYSAILTPKGRMLSDLYLYRLPGETETFLLDVPAEGLPAMLDHFGKVLPPRLARFEDASSDYRLVTVAGPAAVAVVGQTVAMDSERLGGLSPDEVVVADGIVVGRSEDLSVESFDMMIPEDRWENAEKSLSRAGGEWAGAELWNTLRLEAGTPAFGADMSADTIPVEAGIDDRAIDHDKGCYTGQEVIVRIRHRGHVNRHLRTLVLTSTAGGVGSSVAPGDALFQAGVDKTVGSITSVARSPDGGSTIALGYVRREVELGSDVLVGRQDGPRAKVLERGPVV